MGNYDCCNCIHHGVCYKIIKYHISQKRVGIYCPSFISKNIIDDFANKLKEYPIKCGLPLLGLSTKAEIEDYFDGIMLQFRDAIDNVSKEMRGENDF